MEILNGVNIFNGELSPEQAIGPMICSSDIKLSSDEIEFLNRGPKFMVSKEFSREEFCVEVEKGIIKKTWNESDNPSEDPAVNPTPDIVKPKLSPAKPGSCQTGLNGPTAADSNMAESEAVLKEEARSKLVYNKGEGVLDLGNLKSNEYKFNKYINLPKASSTHLESMHEYRRSNMLETFDKVCSAQSTKRSKDVKMQNDPLNPIKKPRFESNLSKSEQRGLKSLKKRVQSGELVVGETDKSGRFCILKRQQYIDSGQKHVKNDTVITPEQVKCVQNTINDHTSWLNDIFQCGINWDQKSRMASNLIDRGGGCTPPPFS